MIENKKETWEALYKKSMVFNNEVSRIKMLLNNKELTDAYYSFARILSNNGIKAGSCVELGAGTGQYSLILKKMGIIKTATLIDWDKNVLMTAKKLFAAFHEECETIDADLVSFSPRKKFDLCISGGLIEHFKGKEQDKIVKLHKDIAKYAVLEYPYSSITYWVIRTLITIKSGLKWPFGYEKPISRNDEKRFFGKDVVASDWHTLIPMLSARIPLIRKIRLYRLKLFNKLFKMDHLILIKNS